MSRQFTITLPDDLYDELLRRAGADDISGYIARLFRPEVVAPGDLEAGYRAMAEDADREREVDAWTEAAPNDARP